MDFDSLLGNQRLKDQLRASVGRGRISHFYLISGPAGAGKKTLARLLAAAILCRSESKPCHTCTACRKVLADTHPDLITVTDPEHKNVSVSIVRKIRDELFVRPNEGSRKIYLFPQPLGDEGQNALLKVLEEPPAYGVFILLSENPAALLTTVRSRCTELKLQPLPEALLKKTLSQTFPDAAPAAVDGAIARSGGYLGQAQAILEENLDLPPQTERFIQSFAKKDYLDLTQNLTAMEDWKQDRLCPVFQQWIVYLEQALLARAGIPAPSPMAAELAANRNAADLNRAIDCLRKSTDYLQGNVSPAAVCGWLVWALR